MKIKLEKIEVQTKGDKELIDVTLEVERVVPESGVRQGVVNILTMHTSSGIIVTEGLPCLEMDVLNHVEALAPDEGGHYHNRYLDLDGRLGFNAGAHLKSVPAVTRLIPHRGSVDSEGLTPADLLRRVRWPPGTDLCRAGFGHHLGGPITN